MATVPTRKNPRIAGVSAPRPASRLRQKVAEPGEETSLWKETWVIPGASLVAVTSDLAGAITVNLYTSVDIPWASNIDEFVKVTLEYNAVPIPGSLLLLGSGVLGLIGIRRKLMG
jgi:hypothetical protein